MLMPPFAALSAPTLYLIQLKSAIITPSEMRQIITHYPLPTTYYLLPTTYYLLPTTEVTLHQFRKIPVFLTDCEPLTCSQN
jgi:hypothetical protein